MSDVKLQRVSMADYVECRKCRASVHTQNDGMASHARHRHPRTDPQGMYRPAPDRWVIPDSLDGQNDHD